MVEADLKSARAKWPQGVWPLVFLAVLIVLVGATAYEAAVAVGAIPLKPQPIREPIILGAAVLVLLIGCGLAAIYATRPVPRPGALGALIAPAAAAFVTARFYSYDPYYTWDLQRFSEDEPVAWVFVLVGVALIAGGLTRIRPRAGMLLTAVVLAFTAYTELLLFEAGH